MTASERYLPIAQYAGPSRWSRRLPVIVLALVGCALAGYLSLYQWRLTTTVWDPIFGSASRPMTRSSPP